MEFTLKAVFFCVLSTNIVSSQSTIETLNPSTYQDFTCGKLYYRALHLDEKRDALYVGSMDRIFKVKLGNVSKTSCEYDSIHLEPSNVGNCVSKGKSEHYHCRNHIRVIQPIGNGNRIYVCGTNAHNPKDWVINANLTHLARSEYVPGIGNGIAKCPFNPEDNSTAIWVENGNPDGLPALYSGTNAEFTQADSVIFRADLYDLSSGRKKHSFKRTIKYDSHMLDKPDFVGSYEIGDYVYFFFRETAVEYMNCGKNVYSRIARVCKKDTGGKNILTQNWATYLKVRLNCSIKGEFPFYFNEIQNVYKIPGDDSKFYTVFTTSMNGLMGSAICTFSLKNVEKAFMGKFKEQASSTSAWLPVLSSSVPEPRPGTCVSNTQELPDGVLNFIRSHPLMDEVVNHDHSKPVFYKRDVIFSHLVIDKVQAGIYGNEVEYDVFFVGTNEGKIYKVVQWEDESGDSRSILLDVFRATWPDPIRAMEISRKTSSLYVTSDDAVRAIRLDLCGARYGNCLRCVHDPYCGWDKDAGKCRRYRPGFLQDVTNSSAGICDTSVTKKKLAANWGQSVHLTCDLNLPSLAGAPPPVSWYHYSKEKGRYLVRFTPDKYVLTSDLGLVVIGIGEEDAGRYDCKFGSDIVASYNIVVDSHRCSAPNKTADYQKIYSDWCHEFEKYKLALKSWEKKQSQCGRTERRRLPDSNNMPNEIYHNSPYL